MKASLPETSQGEVLVYLVSPGASAQGHNPEYVHKIARCLSDSGRFKICVITGGRFMPSLIWGNRNYHLIEFPGLDMSRTEARKFGVYRLFAQVFRGIVRIKISLAFIRSLDKYLRHNGRPAIIHFLDYEYISLWLFILKWRRSREFVLVLTAHLADFDRNLRSVRGLYKRVIKGMWRRCIRESGSVITHGREISERLIKQLDLGPEDFGRIIVNQYPSDCQGVILEKKVARAKLGIPENVSVALFFGMIRPDKRLDVAIAACGLTKRNPWLVIAGRPELVSVSGIDGWIRDAGLEDRCIKHLRYINDQEIPVFYSCADVFLATHDGTFCSQSGPLSLCRAYRLPAVVSDVGEIGQFVKRHGLGLTATPGDPKLFAEMMNRLLADENQYKSIQVALEKAAYTFSWDKFCSTLQEAYLYALRQGTKADTLHQRVG